MFHDIFSLLREQKKIVRLIGTVKLLRFNSLLKHWNILFIRLIETTVGSGYTESCKGYVLKERKRLIMLG